MQYPNEIPVSRRRGLAPPPLILIACPPSFLLLQHSPPPASNPSDWINRVNDHIIRKGKKTPFLPVLSLLKIYLTRKTKNTIFNRFALQSKQRCCSL